MLLFQGCVAMPKAHILMFVSVCRYVMVIGQSQASVFPFLFEGCFEPCLRALTET